MAEKFVEIKFDQKKLNRLKAMLNNYPKALEKIIPRALNKTIMSARTQVTRALATKIGIKISAIRKLMDYTKATFYGWQARLYISDSRIPLINFGAKQTKKGVSYTINKKSGRKTLAGAFIATMPSGHTGVFERRWDERLPIDEKKGPSLGVVYQNAPGMAAKITAEAYKDLEKNIDVQTRLFLNKIKGAAA